MFNQEDLDALSNATGISEVEIMADEKIGAEYILRQRMYHAMGQQGPLTPAMLVDMLRSLNYQPPARKAPLTAVEIRWEDQRIGTRVIYTPEAKKPERKFYGVFKGKTEPGYIAVLLDGAVDGYVDEFATRTVTLAPADAPFFVKPQDREIDSLVEKPKPEPVVEELNDFGEWENSQSQNEPLEGTELPGSIVRGEVDRNDPEGKVHVPVMARDWSEVDPGTRVVFEHNGDLVDAEFLEDGPPDGHVTIQYASQIKVVPEEMIAL